MEKKLQNGLKAGDFAIYTRNGYELVKIEEISSIDINVLISWPEKPHKDTQWVYGISLITLDQFEIEFESLVQDLFELQEVIEEHTGKLIKYI